MIRLVIMDIKPNDDRNATLEAISRCARTVTLKLLQAIERAVDEARDPAIALAAYEALCRAERARIG